MNVTVGRLATAVRPHRSHRTLRVTRFSFLLNAIALIVAVVLTYVALYYAWPAATGSVTNLLQNLGFVTASASDTYVNLAQTLPIPDLPVLSVIRALIVAGVCALLLIAGSLIPGNKTPVRFWILVNLLILMITALWGFFTGRVAYDAVGFMQLVGRTSMLMILAAPVFAIVVAALLPFSFLERLFMVVASVALDFVIALIRLAAFPLLLARFGTIAEPNMYFFFGPLLDVVYFITVYSLCVVSLSRRIAKNEEAWVWL